MRREPRRRIAIRWNVEIALENDEGGRAALSYRTLECRVSTRWRVMMGGEMRESGKCKVKKYYCSIQVILLPLPRLLFALRRSTSPVSSDGERGVF